MPRRRFLRILASLTAATGLGPKIFAQGMRPTAPPIDFPFPLVSVPGEEALAEWERLRAAGAGWPVILGSDDDVATVAENLGFNGDERPAGSVAPSAAAILEAAEKIDALAELKRFFDEEYGEDPVEAEIGEWPASGTNAPMTLTVAIDILTGRYLDRVHIATIPTDDPAAAPAFLRWGGWNACPPSEVHVAVMKRWHARYGAEIVGMTGDVINVRARKRPETKEEALTLAREQFLYCSDIVLQGTGDLAPLAASLMESDWWYFWWD